ncbi:Hydroxyacyl-thioester dehydratase type 2, mitochondrial [Lachnellula subtilissima]|uniref:Hydroxyacyl-thioester dehydratase type 2, mitochondrial n=1 Tax=Lachnellula subtilissima TaxID=602034 RepID=A0A8H8RIW7_9HELO|nr:Hydroxyacyl-thioester dehydratase type 2, mitochondrial [Lachnellula subtilissima]
MKSFGVKSLQRSLRSSSPNPIPKSLARCSSTQASLYKKLTSRPPNRIFDDLSPMLSHRLNITLADFLPPSCYPPGFDRNDPNPSIERRHARHRTLPPGHHLVYFPTQVPDSELLPDGTDSVQSPGEPFVRRMWAGGSLKFSYGGGVSFDTDSRSEGYWCEEQVKNVTMKGEGDNEKAFVTIERRIREDDSKKDEVPSHDAVIETRDLVFMKKEKVQPPPKKLLTGQTESLNPDFSVSMTPTKTLLARFSGLSFNAHFIHLDPQYAREVEGHRDLLVHGPLSLIMMLSVLNPQLKEHERISSFDYRNLAPLYANEEMKICVRRDREKKSRFNVWIEGSGGGYAVKGSALVINQGEVGNG